MGGVYYTGQKSMPGNPLSQLSVTNISDRTMLVQ